MSLHHNHDKVICLLMENKSIGLKLIIKMSSAATQFCLGSISNDFDAVDIREVHLKRNVYDFSVDYYAFDKSDILNIHKYLIVTNHMK